MPELTIGMPTYDDFDGVFFTVQALRLYHDLRDTELLVVDNFGCDATREFIQGCTGARYLLAPEIRGAAPAKDLVVREARGETVLCCDCHVLFLPGAIDRLRGWFRANPNSSDLVQGPLVYDDTTTLMTHFEPVWRNQMWGIWASDARGADVDGPAFEIPMQGLGAFACRRRAWPGFHPDFRGFGAEEGYIHEKFRQSGGRTLCLPGFRWMHRFNRPHGVPYPLLLHDKIRNYFIGHAELGLELAPIVSQFATILPRQEVEAIAESALGVTWRTPTLGGAA